MESFTLEQMYYIVEMLGVTAVIASLIYVGKQLNQNTEALQANQRQSTAAMDLQYLYKEVDNPSLVLGRTKPDLTEEEKIQVYSMLAIYLRMRELDWVQYQNGALDKSTWETYQNTMIGVLSYANNRVLWQKVSPMLMDQRFVTHVNGLIADSSVTHQPDALTLFD